MKFLPKTKEQAFFVGICIGMIITCIIIWIVGEIQPDGSILIP